MYAALLFPIEQTFQKTPPFIFTPQSQGGSRLLWGGNKLHSLVVPNGEVLSEGKKIIFHLDEEPRLERNDLFEAFIFCDLSSETEILIQGKTGTVFYFGEVVQIKTPLLEIEAVFTLLEGEGDFCGQISKANRPSQIACQRELLHEVFDWQIGLRTLRRSKFCKIQLTLSLVS
jgi:hypothetical protein